MMLMMQATGESIISIIGGPFPKFDVFRYPPRPPKERCSGPDGPRRLVFKTVRAYDAHFGGFNGPENASTIIPCRWDSLQKPM